MSDDRDEIDEEVARLRRENRRLRILAGDDDETRGGGSQTINIKQVNQSCVSGCAGLIATFVVVIALLGQCSS